MTLWPCIYQWRLINFLLNTEKHTVSLVIFSFFKFYFIFKLYIIVLVLPNIKICFSYLCVSDWLMYLSNVYKNLWYSSSKGARICTEWIPKDKLWWLQRFDQSFSVLCFEMQLGAITNPFMPAIVKIRDSIS